MQHRVADGLEMRHRKKRLRPGGIFRPVVRRRLPVLFAVLLAGGCEKSPPPPQPSPPAATDPAAAQLPPANTAPAESASDAGDRVTDESAQDAAAALNAIEDYYAAINEHDYHRAFQHWGQDGAASGRSFEEFAAGLRDTERVEVVPGNPGRIDPAAGSRYITIPVVVTAVTRQGQEQRFEGTYDLRRTVVDGATEAQRRWHFYRAALTQTR